MKNSFLKFWRSKKHFSFILLAALMLIACKNRTPTEPTPPTTPTIPDNRPKMAIEYFAEYNINEAGDGFVTTHANDNSGYFTWKVAMEKFAKEKNFTISGKKYHLPRIEEWRGIFPDRNDGNNVNFKEAKSADNVSEKIQVGNTTADYTASYRSTGTGIAYAIRFIDKDNKMRCAYRYERIGNFVANSTDSRVKVTVRYIGATSYTFTVDNISNEEWWKKEEKNIITRVFPICGYKDSSGSISYRGDYTCYWSATENGSSRAYSVNMNSSHANVYNNYYKIFGFTARLVWSE